MYSERHFLSFLFFTLANKPTLPNSCSPVLRSVVITWKMFRVSVKQHCTHRGGRMSQSGNVCSGWTVIWCFSVLLLNIMLNASSSNATVFTFNTLHTSVQCELLTNQHKDMLGWAVASVTSVTPLPVHAVYIDLLNALIHTSVGSGK